MFRLSLDWLRRAIDPTIAGFADQVLKTGTAPTAIHRVALHYPEGHPARSTGRSVIIKEIAPDWPGDPDGPDRELFFYLRLLPRLDLKHAHLFFAGVDPATQYRLLVLEDLEGYRFPEPTHCWTQAEVECMLRAYARLHVNGYRCLPPESERAWMWTMALQQRPWEPEALLKMVFDLYAWGVWPSLPRAERLVTTTLARMQDLAGHPVTLLHNDVYPPNIALPADLDDEAILLDWEMAGWGFAELDLAFMFMQPYRSARCVRRAQALDYYWTQRAALEGESMAADERQVVQSHADALWALSLLPVACSAALHPYPADSAAGAYWDAMFGVLHETLGRLCATS